MRRVLTVLGGLAVAVGLFAAGAGSHAWLARPPEGSPATVFPAAADQAVEYGVLPDDGITVVQFSSP